MKVLTITGTRPELIRLAVILEKLDRLVEHIHVYTNQNYDPNLSTIFFKDLGIRTPNYTLNPVGSKEFLSNAFQQFSEILQIEKPDKVLVLGDTNSGLLSILAAKAGIPVYHMEAGNRCYDGAVPEETNRRVIDSCSLFNLPYTENSKQNLINEGFHKNFVFKTGNPIKEVLKHYSEKINDSHILRGLGLMPMDFDGVWRSYALLTYHRTENVDSKVVSTAVIDAINIIAQEMPVIIPLHPRTEDQFKKHGIEFHPNVIVAPPLGFFDFVYLEKHATVVLTDSGTVPEETSLFHIPCIVLRSTTERQELMESGSFILAGTKTEDIMRAYRTVTTFKQKWEILPDYANDNVSDIVVRILLGQQVYITRKGHDEY